jgi:hypothetical protein
MVDDILESTEFKNINISKYLFVSCWTESDEENIALWNMYSKNMKGVRIGLNNPPFKMKLVNEQSDSPVKIIGEKFLPLTPKECFGENYFVFPYFMDNDLFYKKIEYLNSDELKTRYNKMITIHRNHNFIEKASIHQRDIARIKHERWRFQEESRFVLMITHPIKNPNDTNEVINKIFNEEPLSFSHFDLEISNENFEKMELVLGPNCSEADNLIVSSLREKYGVKKNIKHSALKDKIRFK